MRVTPFTILVVSGLLVGCSKTADSGKGGPVDPLATPGKGVAVDAPGRTKGQVPAPAPAPSGIAAADAPGKTKGQTDDPEAIRKEVRDLLSGAKKGGAEALDARRKRMSTLTKEAIDEWTGALKSGRDEAFTLLMNYDRLYRDDTFQPAESARIRRLYEGSK